MELCSRSVVPHFPSYHWPMKPTESTSVLGSAADKDAIRRHLALLRRVVKHNSTNEVRECAGDCPDSAVSISESPGSQSCWPLICLSAAALGLRDEFEALDHVGGGDGHRVTWAGGRQKMDLHSFIHPTYPAVWLTGYWSLSPLSLGWRQQTIHPQSYCALNQPSA